MHINILTLLAVLYALKNGNAQATTGCDCVTNGVQVPDVTRTCCAETGRDIINVCCFYKAGLSLSTHK
jgi:hypothetical protein